VGQGDAEAVGEDDLGVGECCDHVSRASGPFHSLLRPRFFLIRAVKKRV
jgi:hypothetical protein